MYNELGQRPTHDDPFSHFVTWRVDPQFAAIAPLKQVLEALTHDRFVKLSHFLRHSDWEATNNGVERSGRAFCHRQASHFNLRTPASISVILNITAFLRQDAGKRSAPQPFHTCQRGRRRHIPHERSGLTNIAGTG